MEDAPLAYFLYVSRAVDPFDEASLTTLLAKARAYNEAHGVTGLMTYDFIAAEQVGVFCQYVEGPFVAVEAVQARVVADSRHTSISYLDSGETATRLFPAWSMWYLPAAALPDVDGFRDLANVKISQSNVNQAPAKLMRMFMGISQRMAP